MEKKLADDKLSPPPLGELPWLLYTHGNSKRKQVQTFYSVSPDFDEPIAYVKSIPQLRGKIVLSSLHGWLILQDMKQLNSISLFNHYTLQTINLPLLMLANSNLFNEEFVSACTLTRSPDECDDACLLLLCFNKAGLMFSCRPTRCECDCTWVMQRLEMQGEFVRVRDLVSVNGAIYGTIQCYDGLFFIKENDDMGLLTLLPLQIELVCDLARCIDIQTFLLESCGSLYMVTLTLSYNTSFTDMLIYELNLEAKTWAAVTEIGDRAFFIGQGHCTWCFPSQDIEPNSLYIFPFDDNLLFCFNLDTQVLTEVPLGPWLVQPDHNQCRNPVWVVPPPHQSDKLLARRGCGENIIKLDFPKRDTGYHTIVECTEDYSEENMLLSKLPFELIEVISDCMHVFDYWSFRTSCKILYSSLPWRISNNGGDDDLPLLFMLTYNGEVCKLVDLFRYDSRSCSSNVFPLPLDPLKLGTSKHGWLRYVLSKKHLSFIKVPTRITTLEQHLSRPGNFIYQLPDFRPIFPYTPSCDHCSLPYYYHIDFLAFCFKQLGNEAWKSYDVFNSNDTTILFCPGSTAPIYLRETFYFLDDRGSLGVFELLDGQLNWRLYDVPQPTLGAWVNVTTVVRCLVECAGELYYIIVWKEIARLHIFRFDNNNNNSNWVEVQCLGNYCLFISPASSFSRLTNDPKMRNLIFVSNSTRSSTLCQYSLQSKEFQDLGDFIIRRRNWDDIYEPPYCCWI